MSASKTKRTSSDGYMPKKPIAYGYGYKDPARTNKKGELVGGKRYQYPIHSKEDLSRAKKSGGEWHMAGQKDSGPKDYSKNKARLEKAIAAIPNASDRNKK